MQAEFIYFLPEALSEQVVKRRQDHTGYAAIRKMAGLFQNDPSFFAIYILGRNQTKYMEAKTMEKQSLPKLEIEGFTIRSGEHVSKTTRTATWRARATGLMRRAGVSTERKTGARPGKEEDPAYRKLLIKTGICAALAIALLVISTIDTPGTQGLTDTLNEVVNQEFDIDKDIGRLKFVQTLDETEAVFSAQPAVMATYPADGKIVTQFGENGADGVRIEASGNALCIAKATVTAVGDIGGAGYVEISLDTGETVTYYNVDPAVKVKDIVMPGQTIGSVSGKYLYMEMKNGGDYIDPIAFIEQKTKAVLQ